MIGTRPCPCSSSAGRRRAVRPSIMSLGLTPSTPASAASTAARASDVERRVEIDAALVIEHRAVPVRRRRAQADVDPQVERVAEPRLDRVDGSREVREVAATRSLLRARHRETAGSAARRHPGPCAIDSSADAHAVARVVAEAGDRLAAVQTLDDEDGLDELRDRERRLGDEVAQMRRAAQPQARPRLSRGGQDVTCVMPLFVIQPEARAAVCAQILPNCAGRAPRAAGVPGGSDAGMTRERPANALPLVQ